MKGLEFFVRANKVATRIREIKNMLYGATEPEGGLIPEISNDIFCMTAMRLAEMVEEEEWDSNKTMNAVCDIEWAKSEKEIENIVKEYVKKHGQID